MNFQRFEVCGTFLGPEILLAFSGDVASSLTQVDRPFVSKIQGVF